MTADVLISPATHTLSSQRYAKTYNILNNLASDDVAIEVAVGSVHDSPTPENVSVTPLGQTNRIRYYSAAFKYAWNRLRTSEVDIYHHMHLSYRWFNPVLLAGREGSTPVVIGPCQGAHDIPPDEFKMNLDWLFASGSSKIREAVLTPAATAGRRASTPFREKLFAATLAHADVVVVVNQKTKRLYQQFVSSDEVEFEVIPIGVDTEYFAFRGERRDPNKIVTVGRLLERKGFPDLLRAFDHVADGFPDAHLDIIGDGPQRQSLEVLARQLGIADRVTFRGRVEHAEVKSAFQTARLFVHPSLSESFSPVRLEAMATGCPIVATDINGATEMIRDGTDGYVVPKGAPNPLASAMMKILANDELAAKMGRNVRHRTESKYTWEQVGSAYIDIYESLL